MQIHNTITRYGIVHKSIHWIVGLLIIAAWGVGSYAADLPDTKTKFELFDLHKSVGMVILMLVIIRLSWRIYDGAPKMLSQNKVINAAAHTVHYLLYVFMFIQPLSGWAMSSAAGYPPKFFGLFTFPSLVAKNPNTVDFYVAVHNTAAILLAVLFVLHVGGALFHHFVLKDNTIRRMTID